MRQKHKYKLRLTSLIIIFSVVLGVTQDMYYKNFTEADGLPSMQTYEMVQDSNGILWIGTENGLVSYDGESFKRYSHPQLINNDIIEIALDNNGRIFFLNLSNQIAYLESDSVHILNFEPFDIKVRNVVTTKEKNYIFYTNKRTLIGETCEFILLSNGKVEVKNATQNRFIIKSDSHTL